MKSIEMNRAKKKNRIKVAQLLLHLIFILLCIGYLYPLIMLVTISLEGANGVPFGLRIYEFTLNAYEQVFQRPKKIYTAYAVTIFYSVTATLASLVVMSLFAYALSRRDFKYRNILTFLLFFTTLFNGGLVPSYLVNTKLLHMGNSIWIYIIPSLMSAWYVIVIRTFFQGLPEALHEAARIDGASEIMICFKIIIPLATPALASVGFLAFIGHWNNWFTTSVYIRDPKLYSLQYLLKIILDNEEQLKEMVNYGMISEDEMQNQLKNIESLRFSMAVVAAGPMMLIFPFFQRYFSKGLTLGSVKE